MRRAQLFDHLRCTSGKEERDFLSPQLTRTSSLTRSPSCITNCFSFCVVSCELTISHVGRSISPPPPPLASICRLQRFSLWPHRATLLTPTSHTGSQVTSCQLHSRPSACLVSLSLSFALIFLPQKKEAASQALIWPNLVVIRP